MKTIKEYQKRFNQLMESTMGDVRPIISEQAVKFPLEMEVTSVNTELYNFLKANPKGEWIKTQKGSSTDDLKGIVNIILSNLTTGADSDIVRFNIPGQENIGTKLSFPYVGDYTYANNKLILKYDAQPYEPDGVKDRKI